MTGRLLVVHYTPPGVVGGVERIIQQHVALLSKRGFDVQIVAGRPSPSPSPSQEVHVIPEIDAAAPASGQIEAELSKVVVSPAFHEARSSILEQLRPLFEQADAVICHNSFTLHFSMPLTAALWSLRAICPETRVIAWCHDLAWINPLYASSMHPGYPWDLLRVPAPGVQYVTVSEERKHELLDLWNGHQGLAKAIPNGIDPVEFLRLGKRAQDIAERYRLLERDCVLLLPVRVTRRKNIEMAIRAVRSLRDRGLDAIFLISGPTAPHHPDRSHGYLQELGELRSSLQLDEAVIFLAQELGEEIDDQAVSELYRLADVLLFTSSQEGFGLPILEAGVTRLPAVVSDIPVFREVAGDHAIFVSLEDGPDTIADKIMAALEAPPARLFRRVRREFRWDAIVDRDIVPLLRSSSSPS